MQFRPSNALIFQSRTVLDAISTLERPSFFNQEPLLMQFRPSNALIFQSRTTLDAILTLERSHFSIKNKNGLNCPSSIAHKHPLSSHPTVPYFSYTTFSRLDNSR